MWHPWLGSLARERMTRGPCTVPHKGCWTSGTSKAQNQLAETLDFCRELCVAASCKDFLHKQIHRTFLGALLLPYRGLWYRLRSVGHKIPCFLFQTKCNVITEWKAPASQRLYTHWGCSSVGGVLVYHAPILVWSLSPLTTGCGTSLSSGKVGAEYSENTRSYNYIGSLRPAWTRLPAI